MKRVNELRDLAWRALSYTAYGCSQKGPGALLGFNGELKDEVLQGYALGKGYRFYRPALMRFLSPDVLSPFGKGGVNTYSYCQGDPVNRSDPTGGTGILQPRPGPRRPVAVVRPLEETPPELKKGPGTYQLAITGSMKSVEFSLELKKGPGKYQRAGTVSKESEFSGSGITGGFSAAPAKVRPVGKSAGVQSQGPTIDELAVRLRERWHWEHRPGTQPMSLDQMIPNHQRAHSTQIADIERSRAFNREQEALEEIVIQVLASYGH